MANTQYMNLLGEILEENEWQYGRIETDGDGYNDEVFIFEGYGEYTTEKLNELCKAKLKANGIDTWPDYDRADYYIDFITGDNWGWYDSYYTCSECGKAYRINDYGTNDYWVGDGFITCGDCVRESHKEEYIKDIANDSSKANVILSEGDLEELGFEKVNEHPFEHGMYGVAQHPNDAYEPLHKAYPNSEIVFHIHDSNPFAVYYDCYIRKADEDKDREMYYYKPTKDVYTWDEMKKYCEENFDYGDETNIATYSSTWWYDYGFREIA